MVIFIVRISTTTTRWQIPGEMAVTLEEKTLLKARTVLQKKEQKHDMLVMANKQDQGKVREEQENQRQQLAEKANTIRFESEKIIGVLSAGKKELFFLYIRVLQQ
jgi:hypothetical protein